eukprot:gb/GEZN01008758.1/.p1 GENE.gb/GEZN01008758.1/~~gb/GEZN01008758.1/.p1  ORF type:complete len:391 (-),score=66.05 gb/GEZN01008758.1/:151-1323(-)
MEEKEADSLRFYHEKPLGQFMKRTVLVLGVTGCGKSTVINLLVNGSVEKHEMVSPAKTGNQRSAVTDRPAVYYNSQDTFIDTPGFFGKGQDKKYDSLSGLQHFVLSLNAGLSKVFLVSTPGRMLPSTDKTFRMANELFGPFFKKYCTLVLTHCKDTVAAHREVEKKNEGYLRFLDSFSSVITCNFEVYPDEDIDNAIKTKYRVPALRALQQSIQDTSSKLYARPGFFEKIFLLVNRYIMQATLHERVQALVSSEQFHLQGECPICLEDVRGDKFMLACGHVYHFDCFSIWHQSKVAEQKETTCTLCRFMYSDITAGIRETNEEQVSTMRLIDELASKSEVATSLSEQASRSQSAAAIAANAAATSLSSSPPSSSRLRASSCSSDNTCTVQ